MQFLLHVMLACLGLSIFGLNLPSVYSQSNSFIYQNAEYGISMPYPSGWDVEETNHGHIVSFTSPLESVSDIAPEFLSIATEDLKPCSQITLEEYVQVSSNDLVQTLPYIQTHGTIDPMIVSGFPAYTRTFTLGSESQIVINQIVTLTGNTAYIISYGRLATDQEFLNSFAMAVRMIESLQIENGQYYDSEFSAGEGTLMYAHHDPTSKCGSGASSGLALLR